MFLSQLFENLFANSLKDKPGPSFLFNYLIVWAVVNHPFSIKLLTKSGDISVRVSAAIEALPDPLFLQPFFWALGLVFAKALLNNFGVLAREFSDKGTQLLLKATKIKTYRTQSEFQLVVTEKDLLLSENSKIRTEVKNSIDAENQAVERFKELQKEITEDKFQYIRTNKQNDEFKNQVLEMEEKNQELDNIIKENKTKLVQSAASESIMGQENKRLNNYIHTIKGRIDIWAANNEWGEADSMQAFGLLYRVEDDLSKGEEALLEKLLNSQINFIKNNLNEHLNKNSKSKNKDEIHQLKS